MIEPTNSDDQNQKPGHHTIFFNPTKLFLIDGLGAILSAFFLGIVLVKFESIFGIPSATLYFLASFPCIFATYDFYYFQKKPKNPYLSLSRIAYANLFYCCLSIGFAFYHTQQLTYLGIIYITLEVIIILVLASLELKTAVKYKHLS